MHSTRPTVHGRVTSFFSFAFPYPNLALLRRCFCMRLTKATRREQVTGAGGIAGTGVRDVGAKLFFPETDGAGAVVTLCSELDMKPEQFFFPGVESVTEPTHNFCSASHTWTRWLFPFPLYERHTLRIEIVSPYNNHCIKQRVRFG